MIAAFERMARRYQDPLYRLACCLLPDRQQAESVVADTLLAAWRLRVHLSPDRTARHWLYRMLLANCGPAPALCSLLSEHGLCSRDIAAILVLPPAEVRRHLARPSLAATVA